MVFPWLDERPRADVELLVALESAGFNHVAAPLVRWVEDGRDLGVVLEPLAGPLGRVGVGPDLAARLLRRGWLAGGGGR